MHPLDFELNDSAGHVSALGRQLAPGLPGQGECLGLTGIKEWADLSGGQLVLRSSPGGSTAVTLTVPVPPPPVEGSDQRTRRDQRT